MHQLDEWLKIGVSRNASDLHISSGVPISARIHGDLVPIGEEKVDSKQAQQIIFEILNEEERRKFLDHKNLDKSYRVEGVGNFRVNVFMTRRGIAAVLRTIPEKIPRPEDLGLPSAVTKVAEAGKGLVLVTGPTGSGKSTTLAALINHLNHTEPYHILTVEDPIEFVHSNQLSLINQREIGAHCANFTDALKYALREDPDVILVGEMRDLETISLAMTAAETGHLVFGTLHTRGAGSSVDRIIDSFPANQQAMIRTMLSESLVAVVSQALLKRADGSGRVAAYEILIVNHAISNLIREGKTYQIPSTMQTARKDGMVLMDQYILELIDKQIVTPVEAEAYMEDTTVLETKLRDWKRKERQQNSAGAWKSSLKLDTATTTNSTLTPGAPPPPPKTSSKPAQPKTAPPGMPLPPKNAPAANSVSSKRPNVPKADASKPKAPPVPHPGQAKSSPPQPPPGLAKSKAIHKPQADPPANAINRPKPSPPTPKTPTFPKRERTEKSTAPSVPKEGGLKQNSPPPAPPKPSASKPLEPPTKNPVPPPSPQQQSPDVEELTDIRSLDRAENSEITHISINEVTDDSQTSSFDLPPLHQTMEDHSPESETSNQQPQESKRGLPPPPPHFSKKKVG